MIYRLLDVLECPECRNPFHLFPLEIISLPVNPAIRDDPPVCAEGCPWGQAEPGSRYQCKQCFSRDIDSGVIRCRQNHLFPVIKGIPRLLPNAVAGALPSLRQHLDKLPDDVRNLLLNQHKTPDKNFERYFRHTLDSFSSEWRAVGESERAWGLDVPARRRLFLNCVGIGVEDLPGKSILDAGCGHGEVELALAETGAEVFAIDLSFSVDAVRERVGKSEPAYASLVHIVQSNIHKLPFRQRAFDIIYSCGVLHHTPDTFAGFKTLSSCLKEGGIGYIEIYTAERKNPIAHTISNALRIVTTRLPHSLVHAFCFAGAPFLWLYTRFYNALTGKKLYGERTIREMELSLFDNFSPRYQHHHTTEQVMSWFKRLGYSSIRKTFETKNAVGVAGTMRSGSRR